LLNKSFDAAVTDSSSTEARADMLLGAHLAGCAIENSMLGAAHALANPLTTQFGVVHGFAVGLMLPHVVRFNAANGSIAREAYKEVLGLDANTLAQRLTQMLEICRLRSRLSDHDILGTAL